jgi:predicted dehydrogenase
VQLKVAIIGAGLMGHWHAHYVKQIGAEITAVIDLDTVAAEKMSTKYGGQFFPNLEEALHHTNFEVVHICTPGHFHVQLSEQALSADKHIIIEKPIAETTAQVSELVKLAAEKNRLICPVHQFAFQHGILLVKEELARRNSAPLAVVFDFTSAGGDGRPENELNKILLEILPHPLSILSELWPNDVLDLDTWQVDNPCAGELLAYSSHQGFPASIKISLNARPTHCNMKIYHRQGAIHVNLFHDFAVLESSAVSRFRKITSPFIFSTKTLYAASYNLLRRLLNREPAYPGLKLLIKKCYEFIEKAESGPISSDNYIAITRICEDFKRKMST